jgi:uncharacterized repeat protein (TIGR01451 family)
MSRHIRSYAFRAVLVLSFSALTSGHSAAQVSVPASALEFEDAEIFRPTTDDGDFVTVYDSNPIPPRRFSVTGYGDYARNPLEIQFERSGQTFTHVVKDLGTVQLTGAVGLFPRFEVGTRVPFYIAGIQELEAGTERFGGTESNLGDIVVNGKYTLLLRDQTGIGLAILPELTLPSGNRHEFEGTGKLGYGGLMIVDAAPTPEFRVSANFGGLIRDQVGGGPFEDPDDDFNDQLRWGAAVAYDFTPGLTGIVESYGGADTKKPFGVERKTPVDAIGALRFNFGRVRLTAGGGGGLTRGQGSPDFRLFVGVTWTNRYEAVPTGAGADLTQSRKSYAVQDLDRDGRPSPGDVLEYTVNLINSGTSAATNVVMEDPIPESTQYVPGSLVVGGQPVTDAEDGDAGEAVAGPPAKVVARVSQLDSAAGRNEIAISFRVAIDKEIRAITTVVNQATVASEGGPPMPLPPTETRVFPGITEREHVIVTPEKIELTNNIHFEFDRADIRRESFPILKELASVLQEYPALRVRIEGHTDNVGTTEYNQKLSERRALAVRDFLTGAGIDAKRMEWVGRGELQPIATNETAEGRATNRRMEFLVLNPEALEGLQLKPTPYQKDLAPQSEPKWLREKGNRE